MPYPGSSSNRLFPWKFSKLSNNHPVSRHSKDFFRFCLFTSAFYRYNRSALHWGQGSWLIWRSDGLHRSSHLRNMFPLLPRTDSFVRVALQQNRMLVFSIISHKLSWRPSWLYPSSRLLRVVLLFSKFVPEAEGPWSPMLKFVDIPQ